MAWVTPKTDWAERFDSSGNYTGDYFEATDYQRIKGNLEHLRSMIADLYNATSDAPAVPDVTVSSFGYASVINALERRIDWIKENAYDPGLPDTVTWLGNQPGPRASDLNRIENCCLTMYELLTRQAAARPRLAFTLGGGGLF